MAADVSAEGITINDVLAFFIEIGALVALAGWGFSAGSGLGTKLLLGLGAPAVAIVLWALFAAPRSTYDILAAEIAVKALVLGGGVAAAFTLIPLGWAIAAAVVVAINTVLLYVGPFAR